MPVGRILSPNKELIAVDFPLLVRPKNATWEEIVQIEAPEILKRGKTDLHVVSC